MAPLTWSEDPQVAAEISGLLREARALTRRMLAHKAAGSKASAARRDVLHHLKAAGVSIALMARTCGVTEGAVRSTLRDTSTPPPILDPETLDDADRAALLREARTLTRRMAAHKTKSEAKADARRPVLAQLIDLGVPIVEIAAYLGVSDAAIHATLAVTDAAPAVP